MIRPSSYAPALGALGIHPDVCKKVQCGLITQSQIGWNNLLECSRMGYAGVRSALDPVCQALVGGGPVDVVQEQLYQSSHDAQPDDPSYYESPGGTVTFYELQQDPTINVDQAATEQPVYDDPPPAPAAPPPDQPDPLPAPLTEPEPEPEPQPSGEFSGSEDDTTAADWHNLIGSPDLQFTGGADFEDWLSQAVDAAKSVPWWLWLVIAAALYQANRRRKGKR